MSNKTIAPTMPNNLDAERAVLGAVILDNKAMDEAALLKDGDFFLSEHRIIFRSMNQMSDDSESIDLVTLPEKLYSNGQLEQAGGLAYVNKIADGLPKVSNVGHYVNIIRQKAMLRRAIEIGELAQRLAFENDPAETVVDQALQGFMDLATEYASAKLVGKTSRQAWASLMKGLEENSILRVFSGIHDFDAATGGFRAGELVTITASLTGSGKTLLAQQIRRHNCKNGLHGLYFSGEMSAEELEAREAATEAGVDHWKMRQPEALTHEDYSALVAIGGSECATCRTIDGDFSMRDIRIASRRMKRSGGLSLVVIDYDELVDAPGKDEFAQQRYVTREAKRLGVTLEVPVLMISGIRKARDGKESKNAKPTLDSIYGSGAKSKHSTFVVYVDRKWVRDLKGDEAAAHIWILKSRHGKPKDIEVVFNVKTLRFEDVSAAGENAA